MVRIIDVGILRRHDTLFCCIEKPRWELGVRACYKTGETGYRFLGCETCVDYEAPPRILVDFPRVSWLSETLALRVAFIRETRDVRLMSIIVPSQLVDNRVVKSVHSVFGTDGVVGLCFRTIACRFCLAPGLLDLIGSWWQFFRSITKLLQG